MGLPHFPVGGLWSYFRGIAAFHGGEDAWRHLFLAPSGRAFTDLLLSIIGTLFSATGLAALGSFLIINLGTGFIFYRRYRNILLRKTQKISAV